MVVYGTLSAGASPCPDPCPMSPGLSDSGLSEWLLERPAIAVLAGNAFRATKHRLEHTPPLTHKFSLEGQDKKLLLLWIPPFVRIRSLDDPIPALLTRAYGTTGKKDASIPFHDPRGCQTKSKFKLADLCLWELSLRGYSTGPYITVQIVIRVPF